jgi:putative metalloprotease
MMSSHPDPVTRAETAKSKAEADGLYKAYTQKPINNKATATKTPVKKAPKKKK